RALFGARGDVFTVPAENGPTRNLTKTSGVHERNSKWSPDGKWIAYISDATGEDEIYVIAQDGRGQPRQLTSGGATTKYDLLWSPDAKKILWTDRLQRLQYVDVASKKVTLVAKSPTWEIREFTWSPDSKWVAYARPEEEVMTNIYLYSLEKDKNYAITDGWFRCASPAFSGDGKYLFFVSDRDFNPLFSRTEWNHSYGDMARIYFVALSKDTPSPFKPKSDETTVKEEKPTGVVMSDRNPPISSGPQGENKGPGQVDPKKPKEKKEPSAVKIDLDGIGDRVLSLPVPVSSYRNLQSVDSTVYYVRGGGGLHSFDMTTAKEGSHGSIGSFEISPDGKKMLVPQQGKFGIVDLPKGPVSIAKPLNLSDLQVRLDRKAEWEQIFNECWRQMRDFFYDPHMHGVDWKAMRQRYAPLVKHVNHRADLSYVIGEMIAELNAGHAYVGGGEMPKASRVQQGLLGAELERDAKSGYYRIKKILKGANWDRRLRSPLTEVGLNVKEADYILAVDGKPANEMVNLYESLIDTVGKQVTLKINGSPTTKGARDIVVTPVADESNLYYFNWVQGNIKKVNEATNGKVGYLHVPDMLTTGLNEF